MPGALEDGPSALRLGSALTDGRWDASALRWLPRGALAGVPARCLQGPVWLVINADGLLAQVAFTGDGPLVEHNTNANRSH